MIRFEDIDALRNFLRKDKDEVSLCPLRFINVDSMEMWVNVKKMLLSMSKKHVCLSSFCLQDDTTPNMRRFTSSIKAIKENVCVLPLSEYLRVKPDIAKSTVMELIASEYLGNSDGKLRIYVPMYRMKDVLQTITNTDPRKKDCILLLSTGEDSDYSLTVMQKELKINVIGNEIFGFKQYLQYWEQNPDKPLILHTENAIYFVDKVFFDNVRVIVTAFDLLSTYYHLPSAYSESDGTDEYWKRLVISVASEQSFETACCHELLINRYTSKLFDKWTSFDDFQRWLLWLWTRIKHPGGYLEQCVIKSKSIEDFKTLIFDNIVSLIGNMQYSSYYSERKALIQKMQLPVPMFFLQLISQLSVLDKLRVLTDLSSKEREVIFNSLEDVSGSDRAAAIEILKLTYPALCNYLYETADSIVEDMPADIADYFAHYRWYKAANILPKVFIERVQAIAALKGAPVYELKARNLIVSEEYDDNTAIIFVDGMGVEYVNYIYSVLSQLKDEGFQIRTRVGYCNLPSTTEMNKDFLIGKRVVEELSDPDEMKHGKTAYPRTIENELFFLTCLKEKVRAAFSSNISRIIVTTDHGTSRMAVLVRSTEFDKKILPRGHTIYKYGRYCEGTDMAAEIDTVIEYGSKLIFADYRRFEQKGAPIDEIHGGASLEEWLVPIFIVDNSTIRKAKVVITIVPPAGQLRPDSMTKMVTVKFLLEKHSGNDVSVRIHGQKIPCQVTDCQYEFNYKPEKNETVIDTKVYVGPENIGKFKFFVKQGIAQNEKFDLI